MEGKDVLKICDQLSMLGYKPAIEANDCFYTDGDKDPGFDGHYFPLHKYNGIEACKVLAYKKEGISQKEINTVISDDFTKVITDNGTLLQISLQNCTKVSACEDILKMENITWNNTYALGDDNNDLPVFIKAGTPIAMENATKELKEKAKWITECNEDDGVGKALDKFILRKTKTKSSLTGLAKNVLT
jgi:hydroxymethylpyrimidine pyrophosphatase-like HAD family hydrolase